MADLIQELMNLLGGARRKDPRLEAIEQMRGPQVPVEYQDGRDLGLPPQRAVPPAYSDPYHQKMMDYDDGSGLDMSMMKPGAVLAGLMNKVPAGMGIPGRPDDGGSGRRERNVPDERAMPVNDLISAMMAGAQVPTGATTENTYDVPNPPYSEDARRYALPRAEGAQSDLGSINLSREAYTGRGAGEGSSVRTETINDLFNPNEIGNSGGGFGQGGGPGGGRPTKQLARSLYPEEETDLPESELGPKGPPHRYNNRTEEELAQVQADMGASSNPEDYADHEMPWESNDTNVPRKEDLDYIKEHPTDGVLAAFFEAFPDWTREDLIAQGIDPSQSPDQYAMDDETWEQMQKSRRTQIDER